MSTTNTPQSSEEIDEIFQQLITKKGTDSPSTVESTAPSIDANSPIINANTIEAWVKAKELFKQRFPKREKVGA